MLPPVVHDVRSRSFKAAWADSKVWRESTGVEGAGRELDVRGYQLEISKGRDGAGGEGRGVTCQDDFYVYASGRRGEFRTSGDESGTSGTSEISDSALSSDLKVNVVEVEGLVPDSVYCARIVGLLGGGGEIRSGPVTLSTKPDPVDEWEVVDGRRSKSVSGGRGIASSVLQRPHVSPVVETRGGGARPSANRTFDGPTSRLGVAPSPRRGSTITTLPIDSLLGPSTTDPHGNPNTHQNIAEHVYLIGGTTEGYPCGVAGQSSTSDRGDSPSGISSRSCRKGSGVTDEVWRMDVASGVWEFVDGTATPGMTPREGHTASAMKNGKIVVFGGQDGEENYLGDLWELDHSRKSAHTVAYSGGTTSILEGSHSYFPLTVSTGRPDDKLCISNVEVKVDISHDCIQDIQVNLYGPGPRTGNANHKAEFRGDRVKLFEDVRERYVSGKGGGCGKDLGSNGTTFTDRGGEGWIVGDEGGGRAPFGGRWNPVEGLGERFEGAEGNGEWTLEVYDRRIDGVTGSLNGWELELTLSDCEEKHLWKEVTVAGGSAPEDRYRHTSVVIGDSFYIFGGYGRHERKLDDLWRFDYDGNGGGSWVQLEVGGQGIDDFLWKGRSGVVSPWGLIMLGGMNENAEWKYEGRIWRYDVVGRGWQVVQKANEVDSIEGENVEAMRWRSSGKTKSVPLPPLSELSKEPHYHSASTLIGWNSLSPNRMSDSDGVMLGGDPEPMILSFGGDVGVTRARYRGEMRGLRLRGTGKEEEDEETEANRGEECDWRTEVGGEGWRVWEDSCGTNGGIGTGGVCSVEEVLIMAWCKREYQAISNV